MIANERLRKLLGMLGSEFDGERASAALLISQMAKKEQLSIVELIERDLGKGTKPKTRQMFREATSDPTAGWSNWDFIDAPILNQLRKLRVSHDLSDWERRFIADILFRHNSDDQLSDDQREKASQIIDKFEAGY